MGGDFSTYCIITQSVGDLGGSQLYTLRRLKHLQDKGCKVYIVAGSDDNFMLKDEFKGVDILIVPEINYLPPFFTSRRVKNSNDRIFNFLNAKNIDIIESHSLATSVYAEWASEKIKAKHVIYLLNEDKPKPEDGEDYRKFFDFKLKRGELFGVSSKSLEIILSRKIAPSENNFINIPFNEKEIPTNKQVADKIIPRVNYDLKIFTIARLDKGYIRNLIIETIEVSEMYPEKSFLLLIIGDSSDKGLLSKLKSIARNSENLEIIFTGYLHPVPVEIYGLMDLFVGMGTASINSIANGCATAVIDPRDNKSPGFLGIDTNNFGYPEKDLPNRSIKDIIIAVTENRNLLDRAQKEGSNLFVNHYESNVVMKNFDHLIQSLTPVKEYGKISFKRSLRRKIEFLLINLLGIKKYEAFFAKILNLKTKFG